MSKKWSLARTFLLCSFLVFVNTRIHAQITPDNTLGAEASKLTPNVQLQGASTDLINGGAQRDNNVFHSFTEFNINDGQRVYFANPSGAINILTRITGGKASNILGTLGVDGAANLFLINPNGILFGKNASLDVRGSFVATTANGVQFGNIGNFSATNPSSPALLTVNPSALLFNQINPNVTIQNNSVAPARSSLTGSTTGLRVPNSRSLLLVGGNISMDRGQLNAFGGRVELGGVAQTGTVGLNINGNNLSLSFPEGVERATVSLINRARVNVRTDNGGSIVINARNLELLGGSSLRAGIEFGLGSTNSKAGNIEVNATGAVNIKDGSLISNAMLGAAGTGGDINITAGSFTLSNTATVVTSTFGKGNAGNVTLQAQDRVALINGSYIGTSSLGRGSAGNVTISTLGAIVFDALDSPKPNITGVFSDVEGEKTAGDAGNIEINAASVSLVNGAQIRSRNSGNVGNAGNVIIQARDSTSFDGVSVDKSSVSGVFSYLGTNTVGRGGNISITTGLLSLTNGTEVASSTYGQGDAGNIEINARNTVSLTGDVSIFSTVESGGVGKGGNIDINAATLSIIDGAQLQTLTRGASNTQPAGRGDAGNVNVKVTGAVNIAGKKNGFPSAISNLVETGTIGSGGNITIDSGSFSLGSGALLTASTRGQGNAGTIKINAAAKVNMSDSGLLVYSQSPTGSAGDIIVTSPRVTLDNNGTLNAESASGNGGNINLQSDLLLLRRGAQISTTAGTAQAGGNGGNININSKFLVGNSNENSDILANAFTGRGGNVNIRTQGIFGIEPRDVASIQTSDITASSERGVQGEISISEPDVEPEQGLIELPTQLVDVSNQIGQMCPRGAGAKRTLGEFTITGRGSLPPSPLEFLPGTTNTIKLATLDSNNTRNISNTDIVPNKPLNIIVEAQSWLKNTDGSISLVANAPETTPSAPSAVATCHLAK